MRSVTDAIDKKALSEAFTEFGTVQHVDIPAGKQIAFVQFASADSVADCLGKTVVVKGISLLVEERRKNLNNRQGKFENRNGNASGVRNKPAQPKKV